MDNIDFQYILQDIEEAMEEARQNDWEHLEEWHKRLKDLVSYASVETPMQPSVVWHYS